MRKILFILFIIHLSLIITNAQWVRVSNGISNRSIISLATSGDNIFAGTDFGVYLSTNSGTSWIQTTLINPTVISLAINGNYIFAGCAYRVGVYLSTNNGSTWFQSSLNNRTIHTLAVNGNNIFAGTWISFDNYYSLYLSANNGESWSQIPLDSQYVRSLAISGDNIFAGTYSPNSFYVSNNNGSNWAKRNDGLINASVYSICILNNFIFAGTYENGVWRRQLSEVIGIQPITNEVPLEFSLSQNYPNPFNPKTIIRFKIKDLRLTTLRVFDILGKEIAALVNEKLSPGTYEVEWNAEKFSSGIYFYRLSAGDFSETRKMILVK